MTVSAIQIDDRLGLTLFLATVLHALVILGVGFTWQPELRDPDAPMMEVTLAHFESERSPEDYDFLADLDQDGGGVGDKAQQHDSAAGMPAPLAEQADQAEAGGERSTPPAPDAVLTARAAEERTPEIREITDPQAGAPDDRDRLRQATVAEAAELHRRLQQPRSPSKRFISARTRAHDAAAYMDEWVRKIETVGNLNYPNEARRRGLSGRLILEVTLYPDGRVDQVRIVDPSPHRLLDESAVRIVKLAAPFTSIPDGVLDGRDRLVITRTWSFVDGRRLSGNPP